MIQRLAEDEGGKVCKGREKIWLEPSQWQNLCRQTSSLWPVCMMVLPDRVMFASSGLGAGYTEATLPLQLCAAS